MINILNIDLQKVLYCTGLYRTIPHYATAGIQWFQLNLSQLSGFELLVLNTVKMNVHVHEQMIFSVFILIIHKSKWYQIKAFHNFIYYVSVMFQFESKCDLQVWFEMIEICVAVAYDNAVM